MASKSQSDSGQTEKSPVSTLTALQQAGLGSMMGMSAAWVEAFGEMSSECVRFLSDRIKEDVKTQHQILHCKDMKELQQIQAEFVRKAMEQYQAETGKLMEMSTSLFSETLKDSKKS